MNEKDMEVLEILRDDARMAHSEIARMLGWTEQQVSESVERLEKSGAIVRYKAAVNWDKVSGPEQVRALIEIKVAPRRGFGFDKVAERIYQFHQVRSLYLLSGGYDLLAVVEGHTLHDVAGFVSEKLSTLDDVQSTATHFILKCYKDDGDIFQPVPKAGRLEVTP